MYILQTLEENNYEFRIDTTIKIKCMQGYKLYGPESITCQAHAESGLWSQTPPVCKIGTLLMI